MVQSHWHRRRSLSQPIPSARCIDEELFAIAQLSWQSVSVALPRKHLKQITNLMVHLPNKRREKKPGTLTPAILLNGISRLTR